MHAGAVRRGFYEVGFKHKLIMDAPTLSADGRDFVNFQNQFSGCCGAFFGLAAHGGGFFFRLTLGLHLQTRLLRLGLATGLRFGLGARVFFGTEPGHL